MESQRALPQAYDSRVLSYDALLPSLPRILHAHPALATTVALLLFVGACGKSAQFPLYLWLPDAMAGPTPVSALIHAATMVTSGVVLLNRMHVVFEASPVASAIVACVGAFTALFAALVAFGQTDIKKVLAYSTVSQLGYMFVACGAGAYWVGIFHVTTHAFFKALLFLGSGAVIMAMAHEQDMRRYGRLAKYLPITCWTMFAAYVAICAFSIPGVFGFSGYYSKEPIIGAALGNHLASITTPDGSINFGYIAGWVLLFTALLTAFYMTRMTWLTFFGKEERWRLIPAAAPSAVGAAVLAVAPKHGLEAHATHGQDGHATADIHGFYYTDEELHGIEHAGHEHTHEVLDEKHEPKERFVSIHIPLIVLAILSVIGGYILARHNVLEDWLKPSSMPRGLEIVTEPSNIPVGLYSFAAAIAGLLLGLAVYWKGLPKKEGWDLSKWNPFRRWARDQFGYDRAMMTAAVQGGNDVGQLFWRVFDVGLIDGIVNGAAALTGWFAGVFRRIQTGYIRLYALIMLVGGVGLLIWFAYASALAGGGR